MTPVDPLALISASATPQTMPIPGREAQMRPNNAGGYTFSKDLWARLEDFLILGTTGGTYYISEQKLTFDNVQTVYDAVKADGPRAVQLAADVSAGKPPRAPKNQPALFVLAAALATGNLDTRAAVRAKLPHVARTTYHRAAFFGYWKAQSGKPNDRGGTSPKIGRLTRGAFADLFTLEPPDKIAYQACKAMARKTPQGEPFALRDLLRIAHPKPDSVERRALFGWIAGNVDDEHARDQLPSVDAFLRAKAATGIEDAVRAVRELRVPWEFLPDQALTYPAVWEQLVDTIGMTALIRNLARMTRIGALRPTADATRRAAKRLVSHDQLKNARIHPLDVFLALRAYNAGISQQPGKPPQVWAPVPEISDALERAYELCFHHIEPSGRKLMVAIDSSGSMSGSWGTGAVTVGGSKIGYPYEVACAIAVMMARIEGGNIYCLDVDTGVHPSKVTARTNLREIKTWRPSGGGTNLALPFEYALAGKLEFDGFLVLTDNETWAGPHRHPAQAFVDYRRAINPHARTVVASMTAAGHTIGDPADEGVLNIAGFDASLPQLVTGFIR